MASNFANPECVPQSWYGVARSHEVERGRVTAGELGRHRIALWRGADGGVHALHARCAHLGADLASGHVVDEQLRCPFHHWRYSADGRAWPPCSTAGPERRVFSYPTAERFGMVWVWNGPTPLASLPEFEGWRAADLIPSALRPKAIPCHPHLVTSNGLDTQHMDALHGLTLAGEPVVDEPAEHRVRVRLTLSLEGAGLERLLRTVVGPTVQIVFSTWGGNVATVEGRVGHFPLLVVFSMTPTSTGHSTSRTQFLRPGRSAGGALAASRLTLLITAAVMGRVLHGDREVLDRLRFRPGLAPEDCALAAVIRQVDRMPVFDPDPQWLHSRLPGVATLAHVRAR